MERSRRTPFRLRKTAPSALAVLCFACLPIASHAQVMGGFSGSSGSTPPPYTLGIQQPVTPPPLPPSTVDHLRGVVVSSLDGKPVARVLVTTLGNQGFAVFTDYEGRFSFDLRRPLPQPDQLANSNSGFSPGAQGTTLAFNLRKPGYTAATETASVPRFTPSGAEPEIRLPITPAGLIAGHITAETGRTPNFLTVQLRRRQVNDGSSVYSPIASVQVSASGEYRFPELAPGDYKLSTQGSPDYTSLPNTRPQPDSVPGLLPAAFPDASSLDAATPIHIGPGQTVTANLSLRAAPFYRILIPVSGPEPLTGVTASLIPDTPGLGLSYDNRIQALHGYLPAGNYTIALRSQQRAPQPARPAGVQGLLYPGQQNQALTATLTLHVGGAAVRTPPVVLHPGFDIPLNIRRDFEDSSNSNAPPTGFQGPVANVTLLSTQPGNSFMNTFSSVPQTDGELHIPNVSEGSYRVRVFPTFAGYVASLTCGGTDLLREPLVIGPSGLSSPIEVTLRNDGASLKITLADDTLPGQAPAELSSQQQVATVSVIPLDSPQQPALVTVQIMHPPVATTYYSPLGQFANLAPGRYLVVAVHANGQPLTGLEYHDPKLLESLLSKGVLITLSPNQKAEVRVPVLPAEPES